MKKILAIVFAVIASICAITVVSATSVDPESEGYIEYTIPSLIEDGRFSLDGFEAVYKILPYDIRDVMTACFSEISHKGMDDAEFHYEGVLVRHPDATTWEFSCEGYSIKVKNASEERLNQIFRTPSETI